MCVVLNEKRRKGTRKVHYSGDTWIGISKSALPATVCRNVIPAETYAPTYADWFLRGGAQGKRIKIEWPQRGKIFVEIQFKTLWRGAAHRDIFGALHLNSYLLADFYKYSGCYAPISPYQPF